jgi:hypothetical protein
MMGDDNVPMTFPNSVLIQSMTFDHSLVKKRTVRVKMEVHRDIPLENLRQLTNNPVAIVARLRALP